MGEVEGGTVCDARLLTLHRLWVALWPLFKRLICSSFPLPASFFGPDSLPTGGIRPLSSYSPVAQWPELRHQIALVNATQRAIAFSGRTALECRISPTSPEV